MRVISVAIPKGGEGKTTTSVNLAASLAATEKKTLLIDADTLGASGISLGYTADQVKSGQIWNYNGVDWSQQARVPLPNGAQVMFFSGIDGN